MKFNFAAWIMNPFVLMMITVFFENVVWQDKIWQIYFWSIRLPFCRFDCGVVDL